MGEVVGLDDRRVLDVPRVEGDAAAAPRVSQGGDESESGAEK